MSGADWRKSEVELPPGACSGCGGEGQIHATCVPTPSVEDVRRLLGRLIATVGGQ